jgi:hypothetical protein
MISRVAGTARSWVPSSAALMSDVSAAAANEPIDGTGPIHGTRQAVAGAQDEDGGGVGKHRRRYDERQCGVRVGGVAHIGGLGGGSA